jgi:preprotein translocase subunit SecG
MYTFLLILLILDSIVLVGAVLLQSGKGGGLAASFGGATTAADALIGSRQAATWLSKVSWYGGGAFIFLAFVLQIMSTRAAAPRSILDQPATRTAPSAPPATPPASKGNPVIPLEPTKKEAEAPPPKKTP